jgi:hypothetical protein
MKKLVVVLVIAAIVAIGVSVFFYDMGVDNKEMALRERFKGQEKVCKTSHDLMFKVITQNAQVTEKYSDDFEKIFAKISDNLMGDDAILKLVAGFNPNLSPDMYKELMTTIKTERAKFKRAQDICIDVSREYATYIKTKPQTWFINNEILDGKDYYDRRFSKDEIKNLKLTMETEEAWSILAYKPVTSTNTEDVFEKGVDDNVDLFSNSKKESSVKSTDDTKKTTKNKVSKTDVLKEHPEAIIAMDNALKN